jgi:hypothetical protein
MDALTEVHNEKIRLCDAGLLQSTTILTGHSSAGRSRLLVLLLLCHFPHLRLFLLLLVVSVGLHCDHCARDGHVEAFCYRKKKDQKAQAHHSSQGTDGTGSGGSHRSSAGSETQEIIMLLHRLAASTSSGAVRSMTQPSALTGAANASQSSAPSPGNDPWYLDSDASFHMAPHSAHLSALRPYRHCTVHTADGSSLSVAGQGTLCSYSFHVPNVSLVPDLTMQLMSAGQITDHGCRVILDPDFCYIQDRRTGHLVGTDPRRRDSQRLWELDWLRLPSAAPASLVSSAYAVSSTSSFA